MCAELRGPRAVFFEGLAEATAHWVRFHHLPPDRRLHGGAHQTLSLGAGVWGPTNPFTALL